jgi:hypothetical protein
MIKRLIAALWVSAATTLCANAAAAQVVVLSAQGPSAGAYPQGSVLATTKVLQLKAGDKLELMDGAGTHVVTGPATVVAGHMDKGSEARLLDIFLKSQQARPGIAATRGFTLQSEDSPGSGARLWQVDTTDGGAVCYAPHETPTLARGVPGSPSPVKITRVSTGASEPISWAAGAVSVNWPSDMPLSEGERYTIAMDDGAQTPIVWHMVDPANAMQGLAESLLDKGCHVQLDRLRAVVAAQ